MAEAAERLNAVQAEIAPFLKRREFKPSGRTFRRMTEPGVVQLIHLQAGAFELGPPRPLSDLYGTFTVNLGIAIADLYEIQMAKPFKIAVQEHECAIRARLGELTPEADDTWWRLTGDARADAHEILGLLVDYAFPFLDRFASRGAVRDGWVAYNLDERQLNHVPGMTVALLRLAEGDRVGARAELAAQLARSSAPKVREYLIKLADKHDLGPLEGA